MTGQHRLAAWRGRRRRRTTAALAVAVVAGVTVGTLPSVAAPGDETLTLTMAQSTGTGPFDADDAAGHDSGADNDVVRTNDTVTYTVGIRYEGGDQTDPTIRFTLPQGEELVSLPPFCLTGSSVTPSTLPAPVVPVTATSWTSLPTQTVECRVADQSSGTSLDYKFVSKVRSEVPHGTVLGPFGASATSAQVATPVASPTVSHRVSAAARFDVSKRATATTDNTGPLWGMWNSCTFDPARTCRYVEYPLTINTPAGGKGVTPLASPVTVTDDLSPDAFYGPGTTTSAAWLAAGAEALDKYGARLTTCAGGPLNLWGGIPSSSIDGGTNTAVNSVRDSGTITCTQAAPGAPATITITDADTTAYTVPTAAAGGAVLPADTGYVVATGLRVEIPADAFTDLGEEVDGVWTLGFTNELTDVTAVDINGAANQGEDPTNNVREATARLESTGSFGKGYSGVPGHPGNTPTGPSGFTQWEYPGPPGSGSYRDGNTVVVPGQTVLSNLIVGSQLPPGSGTQFATTRLMCDTWDDSKLRMPETFDLPASTVTRLQFASHGAPAWISSWLWGGEWQTSPAGLTDLVVEYGHTPNPGNGPDSSCNTGTWASTPGGVPGAAVQDGLWTGVNRVRFSFSSRAAATHTAFDVNAAIALRVLDTAGPIGTALPNWASLREAPGVHTQAELIALATANQSNSGYVPVSHTGGLGDRLILGTAAVRVKKYVRHPGTQEFTDTAVPQYTSGSSVDYRLDPTLTADVSAGVTAPVVVEDCLPRYQAFVSSARADGDPITPALVQDGAPATSELVCPTGQTYVRWDLGEHTVNEAIEPIVYTVEILDTVRNGTYTNTVLVSTPGDLTPVTARDDTAQIEVVTPTGIKIAKSTPQSVVEVNPAGVATPRTLRWTVDFANIDAPQNVSDVDVVDVLPADGLHGSDFTGTLAFDAATVTAGTGITVLYTRAASGSLVVDPAHASNGTAGATVWCDAPAGGSPVSGAGTAADCPTAAGQVTGLRFLRPGAFEPGDELTVDITMTPSGNRGGDVYHNRTSGRATGVSQGVGPAGRDIEVISSSIGDLVWIDSDRDGIQDTGETGVPGFVVNLTGTDLDGNPVTATTTTGADGRYLFEGLASGTYTVTFDPASLKAWQAFTVRGAGTDPAADSDGDVTTGATAPVVLAPASQVLDVDQGIVVDRTQPGYVTTISERATRVGDRVFDRVVVSGLVPGASVPMHWELFGPYPTKASINCAPGTVFAQGTMTVTGNGTVHTPKVRLTKPGFYTYVQSNVATEAYDAQRTACGIPAETTFTRSPKVKPTVRTVSSKQTVKVGQSVTDKVIIRGLPKGTRAKVVGHLYGPFETERSIRCAPAYSVGKVRFTTRGSGTYRSSKVRITKPGWYSWSMSVQATDVSLAATEGCRVPSETVLATRRVLPTPPVIPTGLAGTDAVLADEDLGFLEKVAHLIDVMDGVEDGNVPAGDAGDLPVVGAREAEALARSSVGSTATQPQAARRPQHVTRLYSPPNGRGVERRKGRTLSVPSIGVTAPLDDSRLVGNTMAVPRDVRRTGWLNRSAHLGDVIGSTVVAGHVSDDRDVPGALYRLKSVKRGDVITVTENGKRHRFRVTRLRTYDRDGHLPADVFSVVGKHRLNLVTCTGKVTYAGGRFHYTKNLVVTAEKI